MLDLEKKCRVAVVQMAPVMFDKDATLKKCVDLIKEAGKGKADLIVLPEIVCRGGSCVIDPYGHYVTEPVWDKEEIIYADLDMDKVPASRMEFDACGHYARPDVLKLEVKDE